MRDWLHWGDTQLKIHLGRLLELEYLLLNRRGLTHEYQLLWDGKDTQTPYLCGLPDVENLTSTPQTPPQITEGDAFRSGSEAVRSAAGRDLVAPQPDSEKATSVQTPCGPEAQPDGLNENAVNNGKLKTPAPAAAPHHQRQAPAVTHG